MDQSPQWRWLMLAVTILAVFLGAVSMNMQRLQGWSFLILCTIAGLLGGMGYLWARDRVLPAWKRLPKVRRLLVIVLAAAVILGGRLVANRHNPDEQFADVLIVLVALALIGLYQLMSNLLDSFHTGASRRKPQ